MLASIVNASELIPDREDEPLLDEYSNVDNDVQNNLSIVAKPSRFVNLKEPDTDPTGFLPLDSAIRLSEKYRNKEKKTWDFVKKFTKDHEDSTVILMVPGFIFPGAGYRLGVEELYEELSSLVLKDEIYEQTGALVVGINSFLWHGEKQSNFDESRLSENSLADVITEVSRDIVGSGNKLIIVTHSLSARAAVNGAVQLLDSGHVIASNLGLAFLAPHAVPTIPIVGNCFQRCFKRDVSFNSVPFQATWEMLFKRPPHIPELIQPNTRFIFPSGENVGGKFSSRNFRWLLGCWQKKCDHLTESDPSTVFAMFNCPEQQFEEVNGCHIGIFNAELGLQVMASEINNIFNGNTSAETQRVE